MLLFFFSCSFSPFSFFTSSSSSWFFFFSSFFIFFFFFDLFFTRKRKKTRSRTMRKRKKRRRGRLKRRKAKRIGELYRRYRGSRVSCYSRDSQLKIPRALRCRSTTQWCGLQWCMTMTHAQQGQWAARHLSWTVCEVQLPPGDDEQGREGKLGLS